MTGLTSHTTTAEGAKRPRFRTRAEIKRDFEAHLLERFQKARVLAKSTPLRVLHPGLADDFRALAKPYTLPDDILEKEMALAISKGLYRLDPKPVKRAA